MKKNFFSILILVLISAIGISMSKPNFYTTATIPQDGVYYSAQWKAYGIFCNVRINGISLVDNEGFDEGRAQSEFGLMTFISNGKNEISMDVASWKWIDPNEPILEDSSVEALSRIDNKDAYCELIIKAKAEVNGEMQEREISIIKASINDEFQLQIDPISNSLDSKVSPALSVKSEVINQPGILLNPEYNEVLNISRELNIKGVPEWEWSSAPKFSEIPNATMELQKAYSELWTIFNNKDKEKLKEVLSMSIMETGMGKLMSDPEKFPEDFIDMNLIILGYDFKNKYEMTPLDFSNTRIENYANERLVKIIINPYQSSSPINYFKYVNGQKHHNMANHYFAYIDGQFRVVR